MNNLSIEIISTGKKYILSPPLNIGRKKECNIYLDNPVLGDRVIQIRSNKNGDPVVFGPSGKVLKTESVRTFDLIVKKHQKLCLNTLFRSRKFRLLFVLMIFLTAFSLGLSRQTQNIEEISYYKLQVGKLQEFRFGKYMDELDITADQLIVDFERENKEVYLEFTYSDLDMENELEIIHLNKKIYSSNGSNPCFFKKCSVTLELPKNNSGNSVERIRFVHRGQRSSYLIANPFINYKSSADSLQLDKIELDIERASRLLKDSLITSSNLVTGLELIFSIQSSLKKINVPDLVIERVNKLKEGFVGQHIQRVESIEFMVSKNLRLSRYKEAKIGLRELLSLTLTHEYQRKQWINKNLQNVELLIKESKNGI